MKVISLSGGRSSAMMLKIMLDNGQVGDTDLVVFANTGREDEATLRFVNECSTRWGVPIVWLEYRDAAPKYEVVTFETASRKDNPRPFDELLMKRKYLPNPVKRICTAEMKIKTIRRYVRRVLKVKGKFDTYLGLRWDEPTRVSKKKAQNAEGKEAEYCIMPLYDMRVTIKQRDEFWANQPFDLEISSHSDNCDFCYLKAFDAQIARIRQDPDSVNWWIEKEKEHMVKKKGRPSLRGKRNAQFRKEYSFQELKEFALTQGLLFDVKETYQSISCSCTD